MKKMQPIRFMLQPWWQYIVTWNLSLYEAVCAVPAHRLLRKRKDSKLRYIVITDVTYCYHGVNRSWFRTMQVIEECIWNLWWAIKQYNWNWPDVQLLPANEVWRSISLKSMYPFNVPAARNLNCRKKSRLSIPGGDRSRSAPADLPKFWRCAEVLTSLRLVRVSQSALINKIEISRMSKLVAKIDRLRVRFLGEAWEFQLKLRVQL